MATYKINSHRNDAETVEADRFAVDEDFVTFYSEDDDQVLTLRKGAVYRVERE